jgi:hypothetical protein
MLIKLGLIEYVKALKDAGYERLFPEITPNTVKAMVGRFRMVQ